MHPANPRSASGLVRCVPRTCRRLRKARATRGDRGDVPGWVLITVMTAGLVTGLWLVAQPALTSFFQSALRAVHGP
jgi:hypothetical protein